MRAHACKLVGLCASQGQLRSQVRGAPRQKRLLSSACAEGFEILAFSVMPTRLKVFTATLCPLVRLEACSTWPLQPVPSTCSKLYLLKSFSDSRLVLEHDERTPGLVLQIVVILSRTQKSPLGVIYTFMLAAFLECSRWPMESWVRLQGCCMRLLAENR